MIAQLLLYTANRYTVNNIQGERGGGGGIVARRTQQTARARAVLKR